MGGIPLLVEDVILLVEGIPLLVGDVILLVEGIPLLLGGSSTPPPWEVLSPYFRELYPLTCGRCIVILLKTLLLQYFIDDTDPLWERHCCRDFKGTKPKPRESWRELYMVRVAITSHALLLT